MQEKNLAGCLLFFLEVSCEIGGCSCQFSVECEVGFFENIVGCSETGRTEGFGNPSETMLSIETCEKPRRTKKNLSLVCQCTC